MVTTRALRYDTVVLDVGGTLLGFHESAPFQEFLSEAELPAGVEDTRELHRRLIGAILAERDAAQGLGAEGQELADWWRGIFAKTWPDRPDLAEKMELWLSSGRLDRLFEDVLPALEGLRGMGLSLGVLSNFGTHLRDVLRRFGLLPYFEFIVVSAEVALAKPDPRIFDLVVEQANAPRDRILYVGDHVGDDIEGAWGAGIDAVLIDRRDRQSEALCPRIGSLVDLLAYVRVPRHPARAIILDMDGVVLDSMPDHLRTWQEALAPLGVQVTAADLYPLEGVPTERTAKLLTEKLLGEPCSDQEAQRLADAKRAIFEELEPSLVPGVLPLVHDLRGRGFRLGLVTGSARSVVDSSLGPMGVPDLFETIVTGDPAVHGKPDPEPYRIAAERLNLAPAGCLVIENAPLGIESAKAAGMACVALETTLPGPRLTAAGADRVFPNARALRDWLLAQWRQA
ncbi:MAG: HAD-IA family hydrolase [Anaerolineae bacterium]|nr:HAD-IA family hydrolase [Anaerolineae bacterium]